MSAYVVNNELINRILAGLGGNYPNGRGAWCLEYEHLKALKGAQGTEDERRELGQELHDINVESVQYRYPDCTLDNMPGHTDETGRLEGYALEGGGRTLLGNMVRPSLHQLYADIGCWIYQSCESPNTQESDVYKALECFKATVADTIIRNLPEYEATAYG